MTAMLELNDPLWRKLDDAYRDRDIPALLAGLAAAWDQEEALSLFWDCLCHQDTLYGATYAAVPHLLKIAAADANREQRLEIAVFLASAASCAFARQYASIEERDKAPLLGLPLSLEEWDHKLDYYRSLGGVLGGQAGAASGEETEELCHCADVLKMEPVDAADLEKIRGIRQDFISALLRIRALCERAFLENPGNGEAWFYLLSGIAAADGLHDLAGVLQCGDDGWFKCPSCDWGYEYALFGDRVAIYADEEEPGADRTLEDYKEGSASRADGFMMPLEADSVVTGAGATLLDRAKRAAGPKAELLVRAFLGRFRCRKCGAEGAVKAA
jgi:hypothetical protein